MIEVGQVWQVKSGGLTAWCTKFGNVVIKDGTKMIVSEISPDADIIFLIWVTLPDGMRCRIRRLSLLNNSTELLV